MDGFHQQVREYNITILRKAMANGMCYFYMAFRSHEMFEEALSKNLNEYTPAYSDRFTWPWRYEWG